MTSHRFADLKRLVSIDQVLAQRQLLASMRRQGDILVGPCPLHRGDNPSAFVAHLSKGLWYCFTRCQRGGDVVDLVRLLDGIGYAETARSLATLANACLGHPVVPRPVPPTFRPFSRRLDLDPHAPFLAHKGIRPDTATRFETGAFHGPGWLQGCLAVRLHDPQGIPLGYAGRHLDAARAHRYGKWKLPPRFPRSSTLYNLHRVRHRLPNGIAIVECPWSVMRLHQIGVPAIALLGIHLSADQRRLLAGLRRALLLMDGDQAGRNAAIRLRSAFPPQVHLTTAPLPDACDPDDLDDGHLRALVAPLQA